MALNYTIIQSNACLFMLIGYTVKMWDPMSGFGGPPGGPSSGLKSIYERYVVVLLTVCKMFTYIYNIIKEIWNLILYFTYCKITSI